MCLGRTVGLTHNLEAEHAFYIQHPNLPTLWYSAATYEEIYSWVQVTTLPPSFVYVRVCACGAVHSLTPDLPLLVPTVRLPSG